MASSVRFLNGTRTVGGVQIMVSADTGRLLLDLGVVGNPAIVRREVLFSPQLRPRPDLPLLDYLRAGMAPLVENLYSRRLLKGSVAAATQALRAPGFLLQDYPLISDVERGGISVFISHLHEDHMELLPYVSPEVQVLMSETAARLHGALVAAGAVPAAAADITGAEAGRAHRVGDLAVEVIEVDHDVPGSAGVLVTTPEGTVAYTGDWRLHGRHPEAMERFAARCAGVDVLITEASTATAAGTEPTTLPNVAERDVITMFDDLLSTARRGVYCSFHERNLERQADLREVAASHGRTLLLSRRTYEIWRTASAGGFDGLDTSRAVAVWAGGDTPPVHGPPTVGAAEVARDPAAFVCEVRREDQPRLLDIAAGPGDLYVLLNGYPYGPADPGWQVLQTWTRQLGVRFEAISSHGHALPADLQWLVETVRPGVVVPVHSNAPDCFPSVSAPVRPVYRSDELMLDARVARQAR